MCDMIVARPGRDGGEPATSVLLRDGRPAVPAAAAVSLHPLPLEPLPRFARKPAVALELFQSVPPLLLVRSTWARRRSEAHVSAIRLRSFARAWRIQGTGGAGRRRSCGRLQRLIRWSTLSRSRSRPWIRAFASRREILRFGSWSWYSFWWHRALRSCRSPHASVPDGEFCLLAESRSCLPTRFGGFGARERHHPTDRGQRTLHPLLGLVVVDSPKVLANARISLVGVEAQGRPTQQVAATVVFDCAPPTCAATRGRAGSASRSAPPRARCAL